MLYYLHREIFPCKFMKFYQGGDSYDKAIFIGCCMFRLHKGAVKPIPWKKHGIPTHTSDFGCDFCFIRHFAVSAPDGVLFVFRGGRPEYKSQRKIHESERRSVQMLTDMSFIGMKGRDAFEEIKK